MEAIRTRDLVSLGRPVGVLRGPAWRRVTCGLYVAGGLDLTLQRSCQALGRLLPAGSVFGELTAAALHGWWLPPLPARLPITAVIPADADRLRRTGLRTRRSLVAPHEWTTVAGVPVTAPVRTLLDLAAVLTTVDLVVVADSAVRMGHCSADDLLRASIRCGGRGIRTFRRAGTLVDPRSESPWETVLRLMHVLPGLPPVTPQVDLTDAHGRWLARADLWLVGTRRLHEYDGASHRDRDRHRHDLAREKRLVRAGYERYGYTSVEMLTHPGTVIRDAEAAFGLYQDPGRVTAWLDEIGPSLFTPAGRAALVRRWRLH